MFTGLFLGTIHWVNCITRFISLNSFNDSELVALTSFCHYAKGEHSYETFHKLKWCNMEKQSPKDPCC